MQYHSGTPERPCHDHHMGLNLDLSSIHSIFCNSFDSYHLRLVMNRLGPVRGSCNQKQRGAKHKDWGNRKASFTA
jgi:hypothetical protein